MKLAAVLVFLVFPSAAAGFLEPVQIVPGAGQGGLGDLVHMPGATIQGVHVIQGGHVSCNNPAEQPPCAFSGQRRVSLNLDIGAGDGGTNRGVVAVGFDVGWRIVLFDGYKHRAVMVTGRGPQRRPRVDLYGDVYLHGRLIRR